MSEVWNKVYKSDSSFFGEEPSNFALLCLNHMKTNNAKRVLELGAGHGRDTTFFASNGIEVDALDYSVIAVDILERIRKEKRLTIKPRILDVKSPLPFQDCSLIFTQEKMKSLYRIVITSTWKLLCSIK